MENKIFNTRAVVEAGLMSAIIVVLTLMTVYVPILDMVGVFFVPIPIAILFMRHDLKVSIAGLFVSAVILSMVLNPVKGLLLLTIFGLSGITLGYCFKKDKSYFTTISLLAVILIFTTLLNLIVTAVIIQKTSVSSFMAQTIDTMNKANAEVTTNLRESYKSMGASQDILDQFDKATKMFSMNLTLGGIALLLAAGAVISAFIDYIACKSILIKLGYNIRKMRPFTMLYIKSLAGALVALPMALGMFLYGKKVPYGETIYIAGQYIFQTTFLVVGISVVFYFIKNKFKIRKGAMIAIGIFTVFSPIFSQIYFFVGLADMILDFRKINPNRVLRR